jgi:RNA polymerase sporulation-specific sigma factor
VGKEYKRKGGQDVKKRLDEISEEELIQRAKNQDYEAIDFLMHQYKSVVRRRARTLFMIGGDQDDLMQEGMIGLFKAIQDYEPTKDASFATFAELCISRQLYSAIKSSNRQKNIPLNTYISIYSPAFTKENGEQERKFPVNPTLEPVGMSPEEILIEKENVENLREKIYQCLSKLEKKVFALYMDGMTYQEIAKKLDKSPKSIDNALQRIKNKVNKELPESL